MKNLNVNVKELVVADPDFQDRNGKWTTAWIVYFEGKIVSVDFGYSHQVPERVDFPYMPTETVKRPWLRSGKAA